MSTRTAAQTSGRLRLTQRGRRALFAVLAVPTALFGAFGALHATGAVAGSEQVDAQFETVMVQPGDTLWALAERIAPDRDPRDVVVDLEVLNGISGALVPGQVLSLPLQYTQS